MASSQVEQCCWLWIELLVPHRMLWQHCTCQAGPQHWPPVAWHISYCSVVWLPPSYSANQNVTITCVWILYWYSVIVALTGFYQRFTSRSGPIADVIIGPTGLGALWSSITRDYKISLNTTLIRKYSHINAMAILVEGLLYHYKFQGINYELPLL